MGNSFLMPEKPEDKLIIYASRTVIDNQTKKKIKELIRKDLDWNYIIISACRNEVSLLLTYQINHICPEEIPPAYLRLLKDAFNRGVKYHLLLTAELIDILKIFEQYNIQAIPHTGPSLNQRAYRNIALREINWINLIINEKDVLKSKEILLSLGYKLKYQPISGKESAFIKSVREYIFTKNRGSIQINLRWNYLADSFSSPIAIERIWDYKQMNSISINRFELINPVVEDLFLVLCIECAKKQWIRLGYICDIAELVRNNSGLDWNKIFFASKNRRMQKIVQINLYLINELFKVDIPQTILNQIDDDIRDISIKLIKRIFTQNDYLIKMRRENKIDKSLRFQIRENKYDGIKDILKILITSSPYKTYKPSTSLSRITDNIVKPIDHVKEKFFNKYPTIIVPEPYVLTPTNIIMKMLEMAEIGSEDVVYDLGCGNGKIITTAAKKFGVKGVGIDLDPERILESKNNAKKKGVEDLTTFLQQDMMKTDISKATIITMYHIPPINLIMRPKLKKELKPGTRIVTREFSISEWEPIKTKIASHEGIMIPLYLYKT